MDQIIIIEKKDIVTTVCGKNISVGLKNNSAFSSIFLNFTREALEELINDYNSIKDEERKVEKIDDLPHQQV